MNDYISREEAIQAYEDSLHGKGSVYGLIGKIPSADVRENIHGEWIVKENNSAVCSKCNLNNKFYGRFCKFCGSENLPDDVPFYFGL